LVEESKTRNEIRESKMTNTVTSLRKALAIGGTAVLLASGTAQARDLTIVSFGGNFQDAQRELFFQPFSEKLGNPVLDEA
jgi:putative spermidine/putrescine transport system substrate-binding protein